MMRKKNITLNKKKCDGSERLKEGDEIQLFLSDETIEKFSKKPAVLFCPPDHRNRKRAFPLFMKMSISFW